MRKNKKGQRSIVRYWDEKPIYGFLKMKALVVFGIAILIMPMGFAIMCGNETTTNKVTVDDDGDADYYNIQDAIDNEPDGTKIKVFPGSYNGFVVNGRNNLKIEAKRKSGENVIVTGSSLVETYAGTFSVTIGVIDSKNIEISKFTVIAGLTDQLTIAYFDSTGKVKGNDVGGNIDASGPPGNAIAAFGITSPGTVTIEKNYVHDYGRIGILVNGWKPGTGSIMDGIHAKIKKNTIVGTDYAASNRRQDGIQVYCGGSADIEHNDISKNFLTVGNNNYGNGIYIQQAYQVNTKNNKIYNNMIGINIFKFVNNAKLNHDNIKDNSFAGIRTYGWLGGSVVEVKNTNVKGSEYGLINYFTDGLVFNKCKFKENSYGIFHGGSPSGSTATFNKCKITKNTIYDIMQGHFLNTLILHKTNYDTYFNMGGGSLIET